MNCPKDGRPQRREQAPRQEGPRRPPSGPGSDGGAQEAVQHDGHGAVRVEDEADAAEQSVQG